MAMLDPARGPSGTIPTGRSDALVIFGATGDLAYKKVFPALQNMVRRGALDVPVIGVARRDLTREAMLFAREDGVDAAWAIVEPVLGDAAPPHAYRPGTWGPAPADRLAADLGGWHNPG